MYNAGQFRGSRRRSRDSAFSISSGVGRTLTSAEKTRRAVSPAKTATTPGTIVKPFANVFIVRL
jgi:hypothetical protein